MKPCPERNEGTLEIATPFLGLAMTHEKLVSKSIFF
jgi:hypothetical protein